MVNWGEDKELVQDRNIWVMGIPEENESENLSSHPEILINILTRVMPGHPLCLPPTKFQECKCIIFKQVT